MSDIVVHPLTAFNGSPEYTADDFRHAVTPFLGLTQGSAFESVSSVRFGSPFPLVTVSGLVVTVKAHCGIVSPWTGVGTYTYAIKKPVSVSVPDSAGSYKIAVVVEDPSQSHGSVPCGKVKVFSSGVSDKDIPGLVIGRVSAGVASDIAPRLLADGRIEAMTVDSLNSVVAKFGTEAFIYGSNARYRYVNGTWLPLTDIKLNPGQWAKDWDVSYKCSMSENIVNIILRVSRKTEWIAKAWDRSQILTFPDYLKPPMSDINVPAAGIENSGFQLDPTGLYVRPFRDITYIAGSWNTAAFSYSV